MAVTNTILNNIRTVVLNEFDIITHVGVGDSATPESSADLTLGNETYREPVIDKVKDTNLGTYLFSLQLGLTEANGTNLSELGLFDALTLGNMPVRKLFPNPLLKTSDKEVWVDIELKVEVTSV